MYNDDDNDDDNI